MIRGEVAPLSGAVWAAIATTSAERANKNRQIDRDVEHLYVRALSLTLTKAQFVRALNTSQDESEAVTASGALASARCLQQAGGILYNLACFYVECDRLSDAKATLRRALQISELSGEFVDGRAATIRELLESVSLAIDEREGRA